MKNILIFLTVLVLIATAFLWGYLYGQKDGKVSINIGPDELKINNSVSVPKESLKTYKNDKYGFEIQYPDTYLVEESTDPEKIKILSQEVKKTEDSEIAKCEAFKDNTSTDNSACGIYDALFVDGMVISKTANDEKLSLKDWVTQNPAAEIYSQKAMKVGIFDADEVEFMGLDGTAVFIDDAIGGIYKFAKFGSTDINFDQIINSFKLIN